MSLSLYEVCVPTYLQMLGAVSGFLERGRAHAIENGTDPDTYLSARLASDMFPLSLQAILIEHHSLGTINMLKTGKGGIPTKTPPASYADLVKLIADARQTVAGFSPDEIDALDNSDVVFEVGQNKLPFTSKNFLLSFGLPNFYFHVTTAYDILRAQGAPLGKIDYLGQLRMKA
ncbi:MAG: DUF1993 domain-containing protein [Caulobacterales bacterium]